MKIINNIAALLVGIVLLTGCNDDITSPAYTVGEADNAIVLRAGISEGGAGVPTRAGAEDNHAKHVAFSSGTKATLQVNGDWWKQGDDHATPISQPTTATIGDETATDSKHNSLAMSPQLYWDDYGTADPSNTSAGKGREKGLTIYGVAVDGVETAPVVDGSAGKQWEGYAWTLVADPKTTYWDKKDLLISNNVKEGTGDGCFKFDTSPRSKLLEFTHAMSKITVRLIASDGFPTTGSVGNTTNKFKSAPEVVLTSNEGESTSNTEWPFTSGTVDITTGDITNQAGSAKVKMHTQSITDVNYTAIYDALVMPGSCFGTTDDAIIACINADDNIYYVKAKEIRKKLHDLNASTDYKTEPGKNYIITVNVKKTKIEVTATIKNWIDVEAATENPVININAQVGNKGTTGGSFTSFDFYLSTTAASGYADQGTAFGTPDGSTKWTFKDAGSNTISLYWPTHNTHYFMRGVSPSNTTVVDNKHITVANGEYNAITSPSNLIIGAPEITTGTMCGSTDHTSVDMSTNGICARNNTINLNFQYVMSQVEVRLKSTGTDALKNKVTIDANTTVEIVGGYDKARILLNTRKHDEYTDADKSTLYSMHALTTPPAGYTRAMHDIIVPQTLTDDMRFKITVKNSDDTYDVYYAQLNKIKVKTLDDSGALITEWKPGEHYIYELDIKKTEVKVTATITDWVTVTASEDVWF